MGKETLDTNTYGHSRGRSGSFSVNDQQTGRELLTPDEVRMLDNRKAILFVRGERPMLDDTVYPEKFSFVLSNGLVLCEMRR